MSVRREAVLVFRVGQLGDSLVSVPAVDAIRRGHPGAALVLLTDRPRSNDSVTAWDVFGPTGWFDRAIFSLPADSPVERWRLARTIRGVGPGTVYYLTPMPRAAWQVVRDWLFFRFACGISRCRGFTSTGPYPVRASDGRLATLPRESQRLFALVRRYLAGDDNGARSVGLTLGRDHHARIEALLQRRGFLTGRLIAIAPGSKLQATQWPEERFAELGRALLERFPDVHIVLLGSSAERKLGERIANAWSTRSENLMGRLAVWESAALLQRCRLFIGNDSGPMHLAASVGTPCVAIFSARENPGKWEPMGDGHTVLRHEVPCAGCVLQTCIVNDRLCLRKISVLQVLEAATVHLERDGLPFASVV